LRQGFEDKVYHNEDKVYHSLPHCGRLCLQGLPSLGPVKGNNAVKTIHEGRSDYPMSPQQPKFCLIGSSRLPMRPVTPQAPGGDVSKRARDEYGESVRKRTSPTEQERIESAKVLSLGRRQRRDVSSPCTCTQE
jgi:hypothetical protein